ncbi:MAG: class II fructose-bisphosphate aldolase [Marinilabiliales bacterium]|nr:class II fructose-bisphosphate aldolase [Marinilabiliales bacterium]
MRCAWSCVVVPAFVPGYGKVSPGYTRRDSRRSHVDTDRPALKTRRSMGYDAGVPITRLPGGTTMPVSYKDLGLANTNDMFRRAFAGQYAVPAYNFNNMEQLQAIVTACVETQARRSSSRSRAGARKYANQTLLRYMAEGAVEHGPRSMGSQASPSPCTSTTATPSSCASRCIETGFSSVMIDGSHLPYEENIELTTPGRRVRPPARRHASRASWASWPASRTRCVAEHSNYTQPERGRGLRQADRRRLAWPSPSAPRTAPTSSSPSSARATPRHPRPAACASTSWRRSRSSMPGFPIVLHGASSVIQKYVDDDQQVRRQDGGRGRRPRGAAAQGRHARRSARSTSTPTAGW